LVTTRFNPRRLRLILDVNTRTAYAAGQWERFEKTKRALPYLRYVTKRDERVRDQHRSWHNLTLPVDDPFWNTHAPPNGWNCRCTLVGVTQRDYDKGTGPDGTPLNKTAPEIKQRDWYNARTGKTERVPEGIDPGWSYNPGKAAQRQSALLKAVDDKLEKLIPAIAAALRETSLTPLGGGRHVLDDWDGMGQRPGLFDLPPVPVVDVPEDAFGGAQGKVALAKAADAALSALQKSGGLPNDETGWLLTINRAARKKMGDNEDQTPVDSKAVAVLEALARHAVIGERHMDGKHSNPYVQAIYRMFSAMTIGERVYRVQLTVKDYGDADDPHKLHALESFEIEGALLGILPTSSPDGAVQSAQPTTGRTLSIEELMRGAMRNDGKPYEINP
jgi:SPP1 gp7 family putative phage head morphogenesis protein